MKKIIINSILAAGITLSSCSGFLDKDMEGIYSSDTFFKKEEHAQTALVGVYNMLMFNNNANSLWVYGDIASDDAVKGGLAGDQADIAFIDQFQVMSNNGYIEMFWQHHYEGISRANNVIVNTPDVEMDETNKAIIIGEAKFLRAYFYFQLVNVYGELPLKLEPADNPEAVHTPLSSVEDVYAQIEADLKAAVEVLPEQVSGGDVGRATKGAALGLLAKVSLFQEKWSDAQNYALQVEGLGYDLLPVYGDNFKAEFDNNIESVFEIQHIEGESPMLGNILNQWFAPREENGYGFDAPTQDFVDEFEMAATGEFDPRLDYTVARDGQTWMNGGIFDPSWSATGFVSKKHLQPLSEIPKGTKQDSEINYTYMRFAEIILIKAEAANELGDTETARTELNRLRKRSREAYLYDSTLPAYGTVPAGLLDDIASTSQAVMRDHIKHERRVELGMEFHRYFDLIRYGKADAENALSEHNFVYENDRYFPIPQSERDGNRSIN